MALKVQITAPPAINTKIQKLVIPKLEELNNIDTTTNGLNDGYLLTYNDATNQWVATAPAPAGPSDIDGGTY